METNSPERSIPDEMLSELEISASNDVHLEPDTSASGAFQS